MADYYEGKLKLNLNLADKNELAQFGHAVFIHIHDSFGINKLRQLLFYTKILGKTDYAFQYVLNKSLNWVIADWFKIEQNKYLKASNERLPNDPEPIVAKLQTADIIDIKFSTAGNNLDLLIRTLDGIELWNYNIGNHKTKKLIRLISINNQAIWTFVHQNDIYYLAESNGITSKLRKIENGKIEKIFNLDFSYILALKVHPVEGLAILAQKNYKTDVFQLLINDNLKTVNLTDNKLEETDFVFDLFENLYITTYQNKRFSILENKNLTAIYNSSHPIIWLNGYKNNYLSWR